MLPLNSRYSLVSNLSWFFLSVLVRFTLFESSLREIDNLLQSWDRASGAVVRSDTPKSDIPDYEPPQVGSNKKAKERKDKDKEKDKDKAKEVSHCCCPLGGCMN